MTRKTKASQALLAWCLKNGFSKVRDLADTISARSAGRKAGAIYYAISSAVNRVNGRGISTGMVSSIRLALDDTLPATAVNELVGILAMKSDVLSASGRTTTTESPESDKELAAKIILTCLAALLKSNPCLLSPVTLYRSDSPTAGRWKFYRTPPVQGFMLSTSECSLGWFYETGWAVIMSDIMIPPIAWFSVLSDGRFDLARLKLDERRQDRFLDSVVREGTKTLQKLRARLKENLQSKPVLTDEFRAELTKLRDLADELLATPP